jgi:hypothetical protein
MDELCFFRKSSVSDDYGTAPTHDFSISTRCSLCVCVFCLSIVLEASKSRESQAAY